MMVIPMFVVTFIVGAAVGYFVCWLRQKTFDDYFKGWDDGFDAGFKHYKEKMNKYET